MSYIGIDRTNGLRHYKYISRKKVGGKWVYTYNDGANKLTKAKNTVERAERHQNVKANAYVNKAIYRDKADTIKEYGRKSREYENVNRWYNGNKRVRGFKEDYKKAYKNNDGALLSLQPAGRYTTRRSWSSAADTDKRKVESAKTAYNKRANSVAGKYDKLAQKHGTKVASVLTKASSMKYDAATKTKGYVLTGKAHYNKIKKNFKSSDLTKRAEAGKKHLTNQAKKAAWKAATSKPARKLYKQTAKAAWKVGTSKPARKLYKHMAKQAARSAYNDLTSRKYRR